MKVVLHLTCVRIEHNKNVEYENSCGMKKDKINIFMFLVMKTLPGFLLKI
jgi:hypothetical protein